MNKTNSKSQKLLDFSNEWESIISQLYMNYKTVECEIYGCATYLSTMQLIKLKTDHDHPHYTAAIAVDKKQENEAWLMFSLHSMCTPPACAVNRRGGALKNWCRWINVNCIANIYNAVAAADLSSGWSKAPTAWRPLSFFTPIVSTTHWLAGWPSASMLCQEIEE